MAFTVDGRLWPANDNGNKSSVTKYADVSASFAITRAVSTALPSFYAITLDPIFNLTTVQTGQGVHVDAYTNATFTSEILALQNSRGNLIDPFYTCTCVIRWGDPGSTIESLDVDFPDGNDANVTQGFLGNHVYTTPGTKTVEIYVHCAATDQYALVYTQDIEVVTPESVFTDNTKIVHVDPSEDMNGLPVGSLMYPSLDAFVADIGSQFYNTANMWWVRFKYGTTPTMSATTNLFSMSCKFRFDVYGGSTGDRVNIHLSHYSSRNVFRPLNMGSENWGIFNYLDFSTNYDVTTGTGNGEWAAISCNNAYNVTCFRCSGIGLASFMSVQGTAGLYNFVVDCGCTGWSDLPCLMGAKPNLKYTSVSGLNFKQHVNAKTGGFGKISPKNPVWFTDYTSNDVLGDDTEKVLSFSGTDAGGTDFFDTDDVVLYRWLDVNGYEKEVLTVADVPELGTAALVATNDGGTGFSASLTVTIPDGEIWELSCVVYCDHTPFRTSMPIGDSIWKCDFRSNTGWGGQGFGVQPALRMFTGANGENMSLCWAYVGCCRLDGGSTCLIECVPANGVIVASPIKFVVENSTGILDEWCWRVVIAAGYAGIMLRNLEIVKAVANGFDVNPIQSAVYTNIPNPLGGVPEDGDNYIVGCTVAVLNTVGTGLSSGFNFFDTETNTTLVWHADQSLFYVPNGPETAYQTDPNFEDAANGLLSPEIGGVADSAAANDYLYVREYRNGQLKPQAKLGCVALRAA